MEGQAMYVIAIFCAAIGAIGGWFVEGYRRSRK
jgi:hypothetical protein